MWEERQGPGHLYIGQTRIGKTFYNQSSLNHYFKRTFHDIRTSITQDKMSNQGRQPGPFFPHIYQPKCFTQCVSKTYKATKGVSGVSELCVGAQDRKWQTGKLSFPSGFEGVTGDHRNAKKDAGEKIQLFTFSLGKLFSFGKKVFRFPW